MKLIKSITHIESTTIADASLTLISALKFTALKPAHYKIDITANLNLTYSADPSVWLAYACFYKNGIKITTNDEGYYYKIPGTSTVAKAQLYHSDVLFLNTNDYIQVYLYGDYTGGTVSAQYSTYKFFNVYEIGEQYE